MSSDGHSRQVRKTHAALLGAFNELILERRYADIRIADIIRRADSGRSTFYEHFRNKDDILRESVSQVLTIFAEAVDDHCDRRRLQYMLEHFRENSKLARGLLNGPSSPQVVNVLASLIEERLAVVSSLTPLIPLALVAMQAAEAQLGLIRAWLNREASCPSAAIAEAMHRSATGATRALLPDCRATPCPVSTYPLA